MTTKLERLLTDDATPLGGSPDAERRGLDRLMRDMQADTTVIDLGYIQMIDSMVVGAMNANTAIYRAGLAARERSDERIAKQCDSNRDA